MTQLDAKAMRYREDRRKERALEVAEVTHTEGVASLLPGDPDFPTFLNRANRHGQITGAERWERLQQHRAIVAVNGPVLPPETRATVQHDATQAWENCRKLARRAKILDAFTDAVCCSVAGERSITALLYLAVTSRLLDRPISVAVKGPSAGGKSFTVQQVLKFFPRSAYHDLTAMSEKALIYDQEPVEHRMIVLYEAAALNNGKDSNLDYLIRSLLSENRIKYQTVEKAGNGMRGVLIERPGPTGLILTTTEVQLHPENETRMLTLTVTDTKAQTRAILRALANEDKRPEIDLEPWRALQSWLESGERRVTVPFAEALADAIDPVAVRLRRDFAQILSLIRAHALLHRATRERDELGRIVATVDDYAAIHPLIAEIATEGVRMGVPPAVREAVEKVQELTAGQADGVSVTELAHALSIDKSSASRRVRAARQDEYLRNLEERRGQPMRLVVGEPMPELFDLLPSPEELLQCCACCGGLENGLPDDPTEAEYGSTEPNQGPPDWQKAA